MPKKTRLENRDRHIPRPVLIGSMIGLITLVIAGLWLTYLGVLHLRGGGININVPAQNVPMSTPGRMPVPTLSPDTPISPLLFGTNLGLFDTHDQVLNSATARAALQQMHIRIIRMPTRSSLTEATQMQAAQVIKSLGAVPLIILRGQLDTHVLADDLRAVHDMNTIFGNTLIYYEYGNEEDLQGVPVAQYIASWNRIIPQLSRVARHAHFIGPVNFQYDHTYLATFLQNARPRPDAISWHEYTCDDSWAATTCIAHIDHWTNHIADARAIMWEVTGTELPIMITEWNYAPNAVLNDGKNNNRAFMNAWTARALQTLAANRVFASMQYSCTNTAIPLINTDGVITAQGATVQAQYQRMIAGKNYRISQ